jgi:hypothetical protein
MGIIMKNVMLGSASHEIGHFETLKQPMKQVQGKVQGDRTRGLSDLW